MRSFWLFVIMPVIIFILMLAILPLIDTMDSNGYKALPNTTCHGKYGEHICKDISWNDTLSLVDKVTYGAYGQLKTLVAMVVMLGIALFLGKISDSKLTGGTEERVSNKSKSHTKWTLKSEFGISDEDHEKNELDNNKKDSGESEDIALRKFTEGNML